MPPRNGDARTLYDAAVARNYDRQYGSPLSLRNFRAKFVAFWEERAFRELLAHVPARQSVLDVACGTGRYLRILHEKGHRVTGIDASQDMLGYAQKNVEGLGLSLVEGDAAALPFPDGGFDGVTCVRLYQRVPPDERIGMLREARRVARRWAILYYGGTTPWLEVRRAVKTRVLRLATDARFRSTLPQIRQELAAAGLSASAQRWVLPLLTDGVFVLVRF